MAGPHLCWLCQRERSKCGGTNGSCPRVEADAAQYRAELAAGEHKTRFTGLLKMANEREVGVSQREMAKSTIDSAKADGREIESVKNYGDVKPPVRKTPDVRNL